MNRYIPFASDWEVYFRPTIQKWLENNENLYEGNVGTAGFWNLPWLLWPLIPLAVWPVQLGWGMLIVATLLVMIWLTRNREQWWLVFVSPLIADLIVNGQVDIIPMLGIALGWLAGNRPQLLGVALVLMAAKPQACFLVAMWLLLHNKHRLQALLVPLVIFAMSLIVHGWDWPIRWATGPSVFGLISNVNNCTPWRSIGFWMVPVALALAIWSLRLHRSRHNLGALVAANALITPYMSSHGLVQVLVFSLLPLGPAWGWAGWVASGTVLLRGWFGKSAMHLDFMIAAMLMIGYLSRASSDRDRNQSRP